MRACVEYVLLQIFEEISQPHLIFLKNIVGFTRKTKVKELKQELQGSKHVNTKRKRELLVLLFPFHLQN